jgi:hypothetical protein
VDDIYLGFVCALHIAVQLCYCFVMAFTDYDVARYSFYAWFYGISSLVIVGIAAALIACVAKGSGVYKQFPLLTVLVCAQSAAAVVDLAFAACHGGWWEDGYVWTALEIGFIATYTRRLVVLRILKGAAEHV